MSSGADAMATALEKRLKETAPWIFLEEYAYESSIFRRERYIYCYEHDLQEGDAALQQPTEQQQRASRAMLSTTASLPDDLVKSMPIPDGAAMHQTIHSDATLPHFQGRLLANCFFEGKPLACT